MTRYIITTTKKIVTLPFFAKRYMVLQNNNSLHLCLSAHKIYSGHWHSNDKIVFLCNYSC